MVAEQARQALRNLVTILEAEGAGLADVVRWSIAVVDGHSLGEGFGVAGRAEPRFLVEIDAVAVV